jgi:hypothetical protein
MSSPTVMFALEEVVRNGDPRPGDLGVMVALGPGWLRRSRSPDNSPPIDFLAAPPGSPSGKADGFVGRDEAPSAGSIISGENRVNEGMPFIPDYSRPLTPDFLTHSLLSLERFPSSGVMDKGRKKSLPTKHRSFAYADRATWSL